MGYINGYRDNLSPAIESPTIDPPKIEPRQLIHVNLHWDQLSHFNLNLATIDPLIIDLSYFSSSKI